MKCRSEMLLLRQLLSSSVRYLVGSKSESPGRGRIYDFVVPELGRANSIRCVRLGEQHRLGQRGDRPRYVQLCGGNDSSLVDVDGTRSLSGCSSTVDHRDGGGSNGSRVRLWKVELQKLAHELGITWAFAAAPPRSTTQQSLTGLTRRSPAPVSRARRRSKHSRKVGDTSFVLDKQESMSPWPSASTHTEFRRHRLDAGHRRVGRRPACEASFLVCDRRGGASVGWSTPSE
jgi:hypothetical protein